MFFSLQDTSLLKKSLWCLWGINIWLWKGIVTPRRFETCFGWLYQ